MVQKQRSKILNDMAKSAIKYDNIVLTMEFFYAMNEFRRTGSKLVTGGLMFTGELWLSVQVDIMLALF